MCSSPRSSRCSRGDCSASLGAVDRGRLSRARLSGIRRAVVDAARGARARPRRARVAGGQARDRRDMDAARGARCCWCWSRCRSSRASFAMHCIRNSRTARSRSRPRRRNGSLVGGLKKTATMESEMRQDAQTSAPAPPPAESPRAADEADAKRQTRDHHRHRLEHPPRRRHRATTTNRPSCRPVPASPAGISASATC